MTFRDSDDRREATEAGTNKVSTDHQEQNPRRAEEGLTVKEVVWLMSYKLF